MTGLRYLIAINGAALTIVEAFTLVVFIAVLIYGVIGDTCEWFRQLAKRWRTRVRFQRLPSGRRAQIIKSGSLTVRVDPIADLEASYRQLDWPGRDD